MMDVISPNNLATNIIEKKTSNNLEMKQTQQKQLRVIKKRGRKRISSIEDSVDASIQRLENYIPKHDGKLITAVRNDTDNTIDKRMTITRKQKWEGKQLNSRFKRLINNISHNKT